MGYESERWTTQPRIYQQSLVAGGASSSCANTFGVVSHSQAHPAAFFLRGYTVTYQRTVGPWYLSIQVCKSSPHVGQTLFSLKGDGLEARGVIENQSGCTDLDRIEQSIRDLLYLLRPVSRLLARERKTINSILGRRDHA